MFSKQTFAILLVVCLQHWNACALPDGRFSGGVFDGWSASQSASAYDLGGAAVSLSSGKDHVLDVHQGSAVLSSLLIRESDDPNRRGLTNGAIITLAFADHHHLRWDIQDIQFSGAGATKIGGVDLTNESGYIMIGLQEDFEPGETLSLNGIRVTGMPTSRQVSGRLQLDISHNGIWDVYDAYSLTVRAFWPGGFHDGWDADPASQPVSLGGAAVVLSSSQDQWFDARSYSAAASTLIIRESPLPGTQGLRAGTTLTLQFDSGLNLRWDIANLHYSGEATPHVDPAYLSDQNRLLHIPINQDFAVDEELRLENLQLTGFPETPQRSGRILLDYNGDGLWNVADEYLLVVRMLSSGGAHDGWDQDRPPDTIPLYRRGAMIKVR